jgi:hypothetical protein
VNMELIFEEKLEGIRSSGRPRLRWINDVEEDLRMPGVKRWRGKALDGEEWAFIVREAKGILKGTKSYRKKKTKKKKRRRRRGRRRRKRRRKEEE